MKRFFGNIVYKIKFRYRKAFLRNRAKWPVFVLAALTTAVYLNTLGNEFVWDDKGFINWPMIRSFDNARFFIRGVLPDEHLGDYRPVKDFILAFDYMFFGKNPLGYHVQAIFIHVLVTIFVYLVARELSGKKLTGFAAGLLFGVHPLHVDAITFITSSSDILGIVFLMAGFYLYLKRHRFWVPIFYVLAIITYELALVLFPLIVFYDFVVRKMSIKDLFRNIRVYVWYVAIVAFYGFFRLFLFEYRGSTLKSYPEGSFFLTMLAMIKVIALYLQLHVLPLGLNVNHTISENLYAFYTSDGSKDAFLGQSFFDIEVIVGAGLIGALAIFSILLIKKAPLITFCAGWFFISLLPFLNILPIGVFMQERYTYLASFGFCLAAGLLFSEVFKRGKAMRLAAVFCAIFIVGFFAFLTVRRNVDWKDSMLLWTSTVALSPKSAIANFNLAGAYQDSGDLEAAIKHFKIANDNDTDMLTRFPLYLGEAYSRSGDDASAQLYYKEAILRADSNFERYYSEARLAHILGMEVSAIENYKLAIEANPMFINPHVNLGVIYAGMKKWERAEREFKIVKAIEPSLIHSYLNLAYLYEQTDRPARALKELERAAAIEPNNPAVKAGLQRLKVHDLSK